MEQTTLCVRQLCCWRTSIKAAQLAVQQLALRLAELELAAYSAIEVWPMPARVVQCDAVRHEALLLAGLVERLAAHLDWPLLALLTIRARLVLLQAVQIGQACVASAGGGRLHVLARSWSRPVFAWTDPAASLARVAGAGAAAHCMMSY